MVGDARGGGVFPSTCHGAGDRVGFFKTGWHDAASSKEGATWEWGGSGAWAGTGGWDGDIEEPNNRGMLGSRGGVGWGCCLICFEGGCPCIGVYVMMDDELARVCTGATAHDGTQGCCVMRARAAGVF